MANMGCSWLDVPGLVRDNNIEAVVETGCGFGGSLVHIMKIEPRLLYFGCDLNEDAVRACKGINPGGVISAKSSLAFLQDLIETGYKLRTLFWLDAHFDGANPQIEFPLLDELKILKNKIGIASDVILCDDLRVVADEANPRYRPGELHGWDGSRPDMYIRKDFGYHEMCDVFKDTHTIVPFLQDEGVLAFIPT